MSEENQGTELSVSKEIAKRLTALRLQKNWSRKELAHRSTVNVYTLKHFERTGQISLERLVLISKALEVYQEVERLFKPRQRVDVSTWQVNDDVSRKRGRKVTEALLTAEESI